MLEHPILSNLASSGVRLGVDRLQAFLSSLQIDLFPYPCLHVAGTNGKGSTCRMLEGIYLQAGYNVGLFTSPHLQHINERIRIGGKDISDEELDVLLNKLSTRVHHWAKETGYTEGTPLTYFELITAAAIVAFSQHKVDVAIFEVGLGGRLDATNLIQPISTAIVSIDFDHVDILGADLASIAAEKAGIIKPEIPVIVGNVPEEALRSIRFIAGQYNAPMRRFNSEFFLGLNKGSTFTWKNDTKIINDLMLKLEGEHQRENAAVALSMVFSVLDTLPVTDTAIRSGLLRSQNPGRMEWLRENLLVDCAHNPAGALRLARYLQTLDTDLPITLLLGGSNNKDIRSVALLLAPCVSKILTTHCSHSRAIDSQELQRIIAGDVPSFAIGPIEEARHYINLETEMVVAAGSIFLVGAVRDVMADL